MGTLAFVLQILLLLAGIFMMMIILLQRGRGGGLAGAFGGAGGQSAFGTKAGDVFTWITVGTATVWVLLAGIGGCAMRSASTSYQNTLPDAVPGATATDDNEESDSSELGESTDEPAGLSLPAPEGDESESPSNGEEPEESESGSAESSTETEEPAETSETESSN